MRTILIAALMLFAVPAFAQPSPCGPHAVVIASLEAKYGEQVIFQGMANNGVLEVLVNQETQTWTVLATFPGMGTCLKASGEGIEILRPGPLPDPDA